MILIEVEGDFTEGARLRATFLKPVILSPMWAKDLPRCVQLKMLQVRLFHEELERARRRKTDRVAKEPVSSIAVPVIAGGPFDKLRANKGPQDDSLMGYGSYEDA